AMTHTDVDAIGAEPCRRDRACSLGERSGLPMTISRPDEKTLVEAFSIIEDTPNIDGVVSKLRNLLHVDHVVYHSSKLGASPSDPQRGPYIRLTYPASWIMRYLQMGSPTSIRFCARPFGAPFRLSGANSTLSES